MPRKAVIFPVVALTMLVHPIAASPAPPTKPDVEKALPEGATVRHLETRTVAGQELTFAKFEDKEGNLRELSFKGDKRISPRELPRPEKAWISEELQELMAKTPPNEKIKVEVGLLVETIDEEGRPVTGTIQTGGEGEKEGPPVFTLNGKPSNAEAVLEEAKQRVEANREKARANIERARGRLQRVIERHELGGLPRIKEALESEEGTVTLELTKGQITALAAQSREEIQGIQLWKEHEDALSSSRKSTYIDPYAINYAGRKGGGIGIYYTECGCPDPGVISNYTRLGGTNSDHSRNVGGILRGVSPESYIYCKTSGAYCGTPVLPNWLERPGVGGHPPIYIVNRSNGQVTGSSYTTLDRDWDNYTYNYAIAVFVSPGNESGNLRSPSKGLNTISAGAYDDSTNSIAGFSSYTDSEIGNDKPEFSAPGVNITAGGFTKSGTSMSSPHAAAFSADLMGYRTWYQYKPYLLKASLISSSWRSIAGGYDKVGQGGMDFYGAVYNHWFHWFQGGNSSFSYFDSIDPLPNNGYIDSKWVSIPAGRKMRITLAWLNRGTYTFDHRADAHPIGMDLDIRVYAPSGAYVGGSYSWDNSFETVEFTAPETGVYRVAVNRFANRDTASKLHMGLIYEWR